MVAHGTLVVETGAKQIQHPQGGVVAKLLVSEDDPVKAGQPLVILDQTVDEAKFSSAATSLAGQRARLVRLLAERDDAKSLGFPAYDPQLGISEADYRVITDSERRQFELRRVDREGQKAQFRSRISQTQQQTIADEAQLEANRAQTTIVKAEVDDLRALFAKHLVDYQRLSEMERTLSQLQGSQGTLQSDIAQNDAKIAELQLMIEQVDQSLRSQLTDQISQSQGSIANFAQQLAVSKDALARTVIVSPLDGVVHQLSVHTVGGVVQPAETLMLVVPKHDNLVGEVKLSPRDIDQVYPGQDVTIHFTAFDRGTTPAIEGQLALISPDLVHDPHSGESYYTGRVQIDPAEWAKLDPNLRLVAGMPLELFLKTNSRTLLSYLLKPLADQWSRAFR